MVALTKVSYLINALWINIHRKLVALDNLASNGFMWAVWDKSFSWQLFISIQWPWLDNTWLKWRLEMVCLNISVIVSQLVTSFIMLKPFASIFYWEAQCIVLAFPIQLDNVLMFIAWVLKVPWGLQMSVCKKICLFSKFLLGLLIFNQLVEWREDKLSMNKIKHVCP